MAVLVVQKPCFRSVMQPTNLTILSGDLGIPNDSTDNAYHVLITRANNTVTLIDGFTIKDGNADGNGSISYSGIFFSQAVGGGIYNKLSSLTLTNVTFSNNSAVSGGGLFNDINTYSRLTNVTFSNNSAVSRGGGIYNNKITYSWLANVTFSNNSANDGGGIYNDDSNIYPRLINVTFSNNLANWGGGMYNFGVSNPRLTNVTFSNNSALTLGGGMYNYVTAIPKLNNTVFYKNIAFNGVDIGGNNINASSSHNASDGTGGNISAGTGFVNLFLSASPFQNSTDPAGVDNTWFTTDDGLALLSGSPLLGAGTTNNAPIKDITGTTRPNPPSIGAYELVEPVSTSTIFETAISTFPNPTTGIVQIDLGKRYEEVHLSINNVIGKRINSTIYNHQNTIQLDLSNYPKGVYFINIQSDDKRVVLKLLLE
jgi:predicted outer membrane repeat protein